MMNVRLSGLLTGLVRPLGPKAVPSGIVKRPVAGPIELTTTGFEGDAQGDRKRHGGPEKAVHHYPFEHYRAWREDIGRRDVLEHPGAFGENFSTIGLTERDVSVGDVFEIGTAVLEVAQGRQPCWKLNERFGLDEMAKLVQASGRTGWYYRVLRPGTVGQDDPLRRLDRPCAEWTLARIWRVFYVDTLDRDELARLSEVRQLAAGWREHAIRRLRTGTVEDWNARLHGVPANV